jgi:hypothetical protein
VRDRICKVQGYDRGSNVFTAPQVGRFFCGDARLGAAKR